MLPSAVISIPTEGDNADSDDDNDGWDDIDESSCGTDQFDSSSYPSDVDSDGLCNGLDPDDDNDGYNDPIDDFPENPSEWNDNDNDEIGDNADLDDDNDGFSDITEQDCGSDPMSVFSNHWIQMPMENVMNWILMMIMMVGKMIGIVSRRTLRSG